MSIRFELTPTQRAAAVDRLDDSLALLSGAGCGKTYVLARRFVELLLAHPEASLRDFVALTFTRKAALEMAQRVRAMLRERAKQADGPLRKRLLGWLAELPDARIGTIHSFCAGLLRGYAVEAGLDPGFSVADDEVATRRLLLESADEAVLSAVERQEEDVARMLTTLPYRQIVDHVCEVLGTRPAIDPVDWTDKAAILERWEETRRRLRNRAMTALRNDRDIRQELAYLAGYPCDNMADKLADKLNEQLAVLRQILAEDAEPDYDTFGLLDKPHGSIGSGKAWGSRETAREIRTRLSGLIERVRAYADYYRPFGPLEQRDAWALATLCRLACGALALYAARKRRLGVLDFTDLLAETGRLFTGNPGIRRHLGGGIRQLLIDECQDTDAFQVSLLTSLVAEEDRIGPGRLFVVGDPQQSIYRFRGAQVEVFEALCSRMGESRVERLDLSFRTHKKGVSFVNHLFSRLMGNQYAPVEAHRTAAPPGASVEILLASGPEGQVTLAEEADDAQATALAKRLSEMLASGEQRVHNRVTDRYRSVEPGDVAILFSRMTKSSRYEQALADEGVPYYVVGGSGFFHQQEVRDVLNALRVVDNPYDDVSLFGVLRSGLVGLDDNAVLRVALACERPALPFLQDADVLEEVCGSLSQDDAGVLAHATTWLTRLSRRKDAVGIHCLIEEILDETGYEPALQTARQGKQLLGNVRRLVDLGREASNGGVPLAGFLAEASQLIVEGERFEQAAVAGEHENVVRLMTIHKAKGLEFPVVIVPDLNRTTRSVSDKLLHRADWGLTYYLKPSGKKGEEGAAYALCRQAEEEAERREDLRALYVALTRHQDYLMLVGADQRDRGGRLGKSDSFLRALDETLGIADAVDSGTEQISYADGADVVQVTAARCTTPAPSRSNRVGPGRRMLEEAGSAGAFAAALSRAMKPAAGPSLVGPIPADISRPEAGVTALADFSRCPRLYWMRHELGMPTLGGRLVGACVAGNDGLDALRLGTLLHHCWELLDFADPQTPGQLLSAAAADVDEPEAAGSEAIRRILQNALDRFLKHPLCATLAASGRIHRELEFASRIGPGVVRGAIDLLYRDPQGGWHIVDYKSDRIGDKSVEAHASHYALQMRLYAEAAARFLRADHVDATLYFLRSGQTARFACDAQAVNAAKQKASDLLTRLVEARRGGRFEVAREEETACIACPYRQVCQM